MDPEAYFRGVNNLNSARRGVALQHEENRDEKGQITKAKGHKQESSLITGYHGDGRSVWRETKTSTATRCQKHAIN